MSGGNVSQSTKLSRITQNIYEWGKTDIVGINVQIVRSLLALGTILTLSVNPAGLLLHVPSGIHTETFCESVHRLGAFCIGADSPDLTRVSLILLSIPALIGFLPQFAGPLHFYAAFSLSSNTAGIEGGDQLTVNLSALLILISVVKWQKWGWVNSRNREATRFIISNVGLIAARLQVAYVYFEAAMVKLGNEIWADGTALWYWVQNTGFGASEYVSGIFQEILRHPILSLAFSWGTIFLELLLFLGILFAREKWIRKIVLVSGILLHLSFAILMGLITFCIVMVAALLLATWRTEDRTTLLTVARRPQNDLPISKVRRRLNRNNEDVSRSNYDISS